MSPVDDPLESDEQSLVPSSLLFLPYSTRAAILEALPWGSSSDSSHVRRLLVGNTGSSSNISRKEFEVVVGLPGWMMRTASGLF